MTEGKCSQTGDECNMWKFKYQTRYRMTLTPASVSSSFDNQKQCACLLAQYKITLLSASAAPLNRRIIYQWKCIKIEKPNAMENFVSKSTTPKKWPCCMPLDRCIWCPFMEILVSVGWCTAIVGWNDASFIIFIIILIDSLQKKCRPHAWRCWLMPTHTGQTIRKPEIQLIHHNIVKYASILWEYAKYYVV